MARLEDPEGFLVTGDGKEEPDFLRCKCKKIIAQLTDTEVII